MPLRRTLGVWTCPDHPDFRTMDEAKAAAHLTVCRPDLIGVTAQRLPVEAE